MGILTSLDAVKHASRLIDAMRLADELAFEASRDSGARTIRVLATALADLDQVVAIAATHALATIVDDHAGQILSRQLSDERVFMREHAAWALGLRLPRFDSVGRLIDMIIGGGFAGMLAQRTLELWGATAPEHLALGLEGALLGVSEEQPRSRLVETLGLMRVAMAADVLIRVAVNEAEPEQTRATAIAAIGQRKANERVERCIQQLSEKPGYLGDVARLAALDLAAGDSLGSQGTVFTVAQLFLNADIDANLTQVGSGDNGGIATLLVRLGDAMIAQKSGVDRVLTLSRGSANEAISSLKDIASAASGHIFGRIPTLGDPVPSASAWPLRVAVRRGIRRALHVAGKVDAIHLRMADVGSLAAADVARELDVPMIFTVAPDPHSVIDALDRSGELTRENFGDYDVVEHYWFRSRLVQRIAANAEHTVLFPRPDLSRDMSELVGIDISAHPERHSIVPEGIDLELIDAAVLEARSIAKGRPASPSLESLRALLLELPEQRRGLPLLVSVGRFHRVKGMATIAEAWAGGELSSRANLLLIGGNLEQPSPDERQQLDAIDRTVPRGERMQRGLLLAGHRDNSTVARWVAAVRFGVPELSAGGGIYVCGSLKEEFGIAILEAMATGLLVVAPDGGGPATYVRDGDTGILTSTWNVALLRDAITTAFELSMAEATDERASRSRATIEKDFTIQAMAQSLVEVYRRVDAEHEALLNWDAPDL